MSDYVSTRGGDPVSLADALFQGLASDGGLFVPVALPGVHRSGAEAGDGASQTFRDTAERFAATVFRGVDPARVSRIVDRAATFPVPLVEVEKARFVLELFHGPTHAFKDVGARFMAAIMEACGDRGEENTVLVATSGDTGGAVASAFSGVAGVRVVLLFPEGRVSQRQRLQMTTLGSNIVAAEVAGSFDDCQGMVKAAFANEDLRQRSNLTSANSINIARLLPQLLYYLHAVARLGAEGHPTDPHFVVPSGNLGNLCAGLMAARGGMPNSGFTCAVNANDGMREYLEGRDFRPRASVRTSSSAMDVGDPSNLERIRWLFGGDDEAVRSVVRGDSVSDDAVLATIRSVHERTGYVMDPHTAVGWAAADRVEHGGPVVLLSTAHPAKFPDTVEAATGVTPDLPPGLRFDDDVAERYQTIQPTMDALRDLLLTTRS